MGAKTIERLEITVHDLSLKIEEYSRTVIDITAVKSRLSQENIELTKEVQELKVNIENALYLKSQIASQFEDARRRLEDEDRVSFLLWPSPIHALDLEFIFARPQKIENDIPHDAICSRSRPYSEVDPW
jgi:hypothetical protein